MAGLMRLLLIGVLLLLAGCDRGEEPVAVAAVQQPESVASIGKSPSQPSPLVFEPDHVDLGSVKEGDDAVTYLRVRNTGDAVAEIAQVETSCGCSVAEPEERILMPDGFTRINVTIDTFAKQNGVTKWVVITDLQGRTSKAWLKLTVLENPHLQVKGRTIFDGKCGACHFAPAEGKVDGPAIYKAVCAMCHGAEGEGAGAPSLRGRDAGLLAAIIAEGAGTQHMPAFARERGGPLSKQQVAILSQWLSKLDEQYTGR